MKTLLLLALMTFGGDNATATMPTLDAAEEPLYVIVDAPPNLSAATVPAEAPQADSLWEWPRQFCGLLSEAPAGITWGFLALVAAHWLAIVWLVASKTRLIAHQDGRAEVLEEQHTFRTRGGHVISYDGSPEMKQRLRSSIGIKPNTL